MKGPGLDIQAFCHLPLSLFQDDRNGAQDIETKLGWDRFIYEKPNRASRRDGGGREVGIDCSLHPGRSSELPRKEMIPQGSRYWPR